MSRSTSCRSLAEVQEALWKGPPAVATEFGSMIVKTHAHLSEALATDAGKGWRPPEDVEALRRVAREVTDYLRALDASGSAWSRALRDALAALPERLR